MKNALLLSLLFFWSHGYCQDLIPVPSVELTVAEIAADSVSKGINDMERKIIEAHKTMWETTWENPRGATPQDVFNRWGASGARVLQCGRNFVDLIEAIAVMRGTTAEELLGHWKYTTTAFEVTISNGHVTVTSTPSQRPE